MVEGSDTETDVDDVEEGEDGEVKNADCSKIWNKCVGANGPINGLHCVGGKCFKCPIGTYGVEAERCDLCPFGTWTIKKGETRCYSSFSYSRVGQHNIIIPFGVSLIKVGLWGGGGGGENSPDKSRFVAHAGGGGGFLSCNVDVLKVRDIDIIVGGGGRAMNDSINLGGRLDGIKAFLTFKGQNFTSSRAQWSSIRWLSCP